MDRSFASAASPDLLRSVLDGTLRSFYRGLPFIKGPFDTLIFLQLIQRLKPRTVIEIGSFGGGSALWFADMMSLHHGEATVVSVDIEPRAAVTDPRITFLQGDALALEKTLSPERLAALPRPWLVSEDCAHLFETSLAVLEFFDGHLQSGDYIVVEDGFVGIMGDEPGDAYKDGPARAIAAFLDRRGSDYAIDESLCDFFGPNVTFNPNGWLRRL